MCYNGDERERCAANARKARKMKILGSDYDGTFTCGGVTEVKLQAIAEWQAAGHKFGIVSGRGGSFLFELKEKHPSLSLDFFAACNGGCILGSQGEVIFGEECLSVSLVELVESLFAFGCGGVYVHAEKTSVTLRADDPCFRDSIREWKSFSQVAVWLPDEHQVDALAKEIARKYGAFLDALKNGHSLDIVPKGVNKAKGLSRVAEYFGCEKESVIAVGDNTNDRDMIAAFHSYAMTSGKEEIIALADAIVEDITEIFAKEIAI